MTDYSSLGAATTAAQNQVIAVNTVARAIQYAIGQLTSSAYDGPRSVSVLTGEGRLVSVAVVQSGAGDIKFYDTASINDTPTGGLLFVLDANAPLGITQIGVQFTDGLVMVIGSGVVANVTYSTGK